MARGKTHGNRRAYRPGTANVNRSDSRPAVGIAGRNGKPGTGPMSRTAQQVKASASQPHVRLFAVIEHDVITCRAESNPMLIA